MAPPWEGQMTLPRWVHVFEETAAKMDASQASRAQWQRRVRRLRKGYQRQRDLREAGIGTGASGRGTTGASAAYFLHKQTSQTQTTLSISHQLKSKSKKERTKKGKKQKRGK